MTETSSAVNADNDSNVWYGLVVNERTTARTYDDKMEARKAVCAVSSS